MPTTRALLGLVLATLCCPALAQELPRLLDNMEDPALYTPAQPELEHRWTGQVAVDRDDYKEGAGSLRFSVQSAGSGEESYPQWARSLDPAENDWSGYRALRYWVKVSSADPAVKQKLMCVVVYNGDSPVQQFVRHLVPVGQWVQLSDSLVTYNRDRVRGIIIYLYETEPSRRDDYTWWVDGMELIPAREGETEFDTQFVRVPPHQVREPLHAVEAQGGTRLELDDAGRVAGLSAGGAALWPTAQQAGGLTGLMLRDHKTGPQPRPIGGEITSEGGTIRQVESFQDGLFVEAVLQPVGDRIDGRVTVRDSGPADRPLTLYFALPVEATGWRWWDDIATGRTIEGAADFCHNASYPQGVRWSAHPFSCISSDAAALSLSVPLSLPRVQRTVYDPRLKLLYIAWDFCLTPAATKQNQTAVFEFSLYPSDPAWGLRSAAQRYYDYTPEAFARRIPKDGSWGCWGTYEGNPHVPDLGFSYHWGPDSRGSGDDAKSVRFDNDNGYLSLPYIEFTNMHVSLEGYEEADNDTIMERVHWIADPTRTEPLDKLSYVFPYDARLGPDKDGWMRRVFSAYLVSLIYDNAGQLYGRADKSEFGLLAAKYIPFNADPDIEGGAGALFLHEWWPAIEEYYEQAGVRIDGFGWDNFYVGGTAFDYRREHFGAADEPLLFDPQTLQPVVLKDMATLELQREVVARLRDMGRYLIANQCRVSMVPATLPLLDVFGYEWNIQTVAAYARVMARHKPVCTLPCAPAHYQDPFVRDHLLYGFWPGGYYNTDNADYIALMRRYIPIVRRQSAAGWEPITLAWTGDDKVGIERFGGEEGRELLFSLKNTGEAPARVTVRVDESLLQPGVVCSVRELVTGAELGTMASEAPTVALDAPAGEVLVLELATR